MTTNDKTVKTFEIKEVKYSDGIAYRLYVNGNFTPIIAATQKEVLKALYTFSDPILKYE